MRRAKERALIGIAQKIRDFSKGYAWVDKVMLCQLPAGVLHKFGKGGGFTGQAALERVVAHVELGRDHRAQWTAILQMSCYGLPGAVSRIGLDELA